MCRFVTLVITLGKHRGTDLFLLLAMPPISEMKKCPRKGDGEAGKHAFHDTSHQSTAGAWTRHAHLVCPSCHLCGFSLTCDLCSQSLLYPHFSPWILSPVCVSGLACVCVHFCLLPLLLPFCCFSPTPRAGTRSHHPSPSWDEASWSFLREARRSESPLLWLWQLSCSKFPTGGAGCQGRVSSSSFFWESLIGHGGVEWRSRSQTPTSPPLRRKRQAGRWQG